MSWLSDWDKRIKITVDSSKIDSDLSDFPLLITVCSGSGISGVDTTSVFDELGVSIDNNKKMAVTVVSGSEEVQCYVEIEAWGTQLAHYNDDYSSGDRSAIISGSSNISFNTGDVTLLYDGNDNSDCYTNTPFDVAGKYFRFEFDAPRGVTEAKFRKAAGSKAMGTWSFQGSNDASTWFDLSTNIDLGADAESVATVSGSLGGYKYYQWVGTTGTASDSPYLYEVEFKACPTFDKALIWTKVPTVTSGSDTTIYLYYDNTKSDNTTYIGDTGDTPAQSVWDSDFVGVYHLAGTYDGTGGEVSDSTSHGHNGTASAAVSRIDGPHNAAQTLGGEYLDLADIGELEGVDELTVSCWAAATTGEDRDRIIGGEDRFQLLADNSTYNYVRFRSGSGLSGDTFNSKIGIDGSFHHINVAYKNGSHLDLIFDGSLDAQKPACTGNTPSEGNTIKIGRKGDGDSNYFGGSVAEVRFSKIYRTQSWRKSDYYSCTDSLLTFGSEAVIPTYYFSGYVYERGLPVSRTLYLHNRSDGSLLTTTTSSGNGYYYLETIYSGSHYIVCLDDAAGEDYNDLIIGNVYPTTISG